MTDRYAVIGNPIDHSQSPAIHAAFARQTGQDLDYGRLRAEPADFAAAVARFFASGGRGLNVTVPFKEQAWALAGSRSPRAALAGAANTLLPRSDLAPDRSPDRPPTAGPDGGLAQAGSTERPTAAPSDHAHSETASPLLHGDNTDGVGLIRDLVENQGFRFAGQRVLLLGAGGAARGVLLPLLETGLAHLTIANRTPERALALAALAAGTLGAADPQGAPATVEVRGLGLDALEGDAFDLIVNATSAGLGGAMPELPPGCLAPGGWTYDMLYGAAPTAFSRWGYAQNAARCLDGLGMLVEQAAESFRLWRGVRPETAPVIALLRARLAGTAA